MVPIIKRNMATKAEVVAGAGAAMVVVVEVTAEEEVAVVMGEVGGEVVVGTEDITRTEISTPRATTETGVMEDPVYTTRWSTVREPTTRLTRT